MTITSFVSVDSSSKSTTTHKRRSGRKKFQETRHPVYRGVRARKGKWVCEMREPHNNKSRLWLGTFSSPDMAARAYDLAAVALKGELTPLNFPDDVKAVGPGSEKAEVSETTRVEDSLGNENENEKSNENGCVYFDEEEFFNMPCLIDGLAEGLMLTPPAMQRGFSWDSYFNDDNHTKHGFDLNVSDDHELTLWND